MPAEAWILLSLIFVMICALASGRIAVDLVMVGTLSLVMMLGLVGGKDAVHGFANPGLIAIAALYVVAAGLRETGAITMFTERAMGRPKSVRGAQARIVLPVAIFSAFANNTPIVASFLPVIDTLARRTGIPASKLYMPLSFSAILGGTCTMIGTSTTLVVAGLILEYNLRPGESLEPMHMFTIAWVGVPIAIVGCIYVLIFGKGLLPEGKHDDLAESDARSYTVAMRVEPDSTVVGKNIEQAGLRHLPGLFLSRIERETETVVAVAPDEMIKPEDILVFVGVLDSVVDLQKIKGLVPVTTSQESVDINPKRTELVEAVVSNSSPLIGRSIRDAGFRARYGSVVVAVSRLGHRIEGKLGDVVLRPGDTLLLETSPDFAARYGRSSAFYLVSPIEGGEKPRFDRAWIAGAILVGMVALIAANIIEPVVGAMGAAAGMILTRCCTGQQARQSVDLSVIVVIGAAFGIGRAMEETGLAQQIAGYIINAALPMGPMVLLSAVYALTVVFTMFITNNAAAVLMFPIAHAAAVGSGLEFMPFAIAIAVAASAEFSTPIGYQTNLMVMGPGGYRWLDYTKFGLPLTILSGVICVTMCWLVFGF